MWISFFYSLSLLVSLFSAKRKKALLFACAFPLFPQLTNPQVCFFSSSFQLLRFWVSLFLSLLTHLIAPRAYFLCFHLYLLDLLFNFFCIVFFAPHNNWTDCNVFLDLFVNLPKSTHLLPHYPNKPPIRENGIACWIFILNHLIIEYWKYLNWVDRYLSIYQICESSIFLWLDQ